jgi:hypothetical protein
MDKQPSQAGKRRRRLWRSQPPRHATGRQLPRVPLSYIFRNAHDVAGLSFDTARRDRCVLERLCQQCGDPLGEQTGYGVADTLYEKPGWGFNNYALFHQRCLRQALGVCPALQWWAHNDVLSVLREEVGRPYRALSAPPPAPATIDMAATTWVRVCVRGTEGPVCASGQSLGRYTRA